MKDLIKKLVAAIAAVVAVAVVAVLVIIICALNPWNMPAIFKRNYPEWFAEHPFLDKIISVD